MTFKDLWLSAKQLLRDGEFTAALQTFAQAKAMATSAFSKGHCDWELATCRAGIAAARRQEFDRWPRFA